MKHIIDILPTIERREVSNRVPLQCESKEYIYCLESGTVYLFLVPKLSQGEYGARYHIATFTPGSVFFPLESQGDEHFILVGTQNTVVALKNRQDLWQHYSDKNEAIIDADISAWINQISRNLRKNGPRIKTSMVLPEVQESEEFSYSAESLLYAKTLKWVHARDSLFCYKQEPLSSWVGDGWFPLTSMQGIYAESSGSLSISSTSERIKDLDFNSQFEKYLSGVSMALVREKQETRTRESSALFEKSRRSNRFFSRALESIKNVVEGGAEFSADDAEDDAGLLFQAAAVVAAGQTISLKTVPGKEYISDKGGIEEIAKDNNIRVRKVLLRGEWWREDNGPLLGRLLTGEEDDQEEEAPSDPVALIPKKGCRYYLVKPATGERMEIDASLAGQIDGVGYMFYTPLPDTKLSPKDILAFTSRGLKPDLLRYIVLGILGSIIGLLVPEMTRIFFDTIIPEAAKNRMVQISALLFISALTVGIFELVKGFAMTRLETKSDAALQAAVMDRVMKLPAPFFRTYTTGDLSDRTMAISQIRRVLSGTVLASLMSFAFSLVYLFQIFRYSSSLAKWGLLIALIPLLVTIVITLLRYRYEKQVADLQGSISGILLQFIMGVAKLNISSSEKRAFGVWAEKFIKKKQLAFKSGFVTNIHATFVAFFPIMVSMAFYILFMKYLSNGDEVLSTGTFLAFIVSYTAFQKSLIEMTQGLTQAINVVPLYNRAKPILHALPEVSTAKPAVSSLQGHIEVSSLSFRYEEDGPLILKNLSLKIQPGEFVALVGESGSGKSTLLRLLLGFEKAESGSIYYDNQDIDSLDITSLRRQFGVVLQNGSVLKGSIFNNIVGSSGFSLDDAWEAAEMVGFDEDIRKMPMGMHTELPAGGWTLSGGQRQRLIIARAIIRSPNILFFDEATSALDNRTQLVVSRSLENLNVTRIVVAHRLSTIIKADSIYVLQNGIITEHGNYRSLMAENGYFADLAKRQQI